MNPTPEASDRISLVFSLFDADGNGYLEPADFDLMSDRVVASVPAAGEAGKSRMADAFRRYGATILTESDADADGRVSPEEFASVVLNPQRFEAAVDEFAEALAALGERDGDGRVPRPEFIALMTAIGFGRPNIDALFDAFGPDEEDRVPVATWADGIRDYYRPEKSGIPGDHLTTGMSG